MNDSNRSHASVSRRRRLLNILRGRRLASRGIGGQQQGGAIKERPVHHQTVSAATRTSSAQLSDESSSSCDEHETHVHDRVMRSSPRRRRRHHKQRDQSSEDSDDAEPVMRQVRERLKAIKTSEAQELEQTVQQLQEQFKQRIAHLQGDFEAQATHLSADLKQQVKLARQKYDESVRNSVHALSQSLSGVAPNASAHAHSARGPALGQTLRVEHLDASPEVHAAYHNSMGASNPFLPGPQPTHAHLGTALLHSVSNPRAKSQFGVPEPATQDTPSYLARLEQLRQYTKTYGAKSEVTKALESVGERLQREQEALAQQPKPASDPMVAKEPSPALTLLASRIDGKRAPGKARRRGGKRHSTSSDDESTIVDGPTSAERSGRTRAAAISDPMRSPLSDDESESQTAFAGVPLPELRPSKSAPLSHAIARRVPQQRPLPAHHGSLQALPVRPVVRRSKPDAFNDGEEEEDEAETDPVSAHILSVSPLTARSLISMDRGQRSEAEWHRLKVLSRDLFRSDSDSDSDSGKMNSRAEIRISRGFRQKILNLK